MKIGFDAKRIFYNRSGLGNYSRSAVDLLAKYYPAHEYLLFAPVKKNPIDYKLPEAANTVFPKTKTGKIFGSYWRSFKIAQRAKVEQLDVYHGLSNELPYRINKAGVKSLVTIHDLIFLRYPELYKRTDRKIYTQKFKYACDIADTVVAISEQTKSDIIQYFGISEAKIEVVYQGCNPIFYKEVEALTRIETLRKYNLPSKYILNIGTIERRKNALSIVKAVHLGKIDLPVVIIGGKTDYQLEIEDYIKEHNLQSQIFIYNNVDFYDFPAIYQEAEMFIYPSLFEGFGIPIIEAMNSKTPVITTKGGCFSEAGGFASLYVEAGNIEELTEKIKSLLNDDELRLKTISESYKYVQKFSEDKVAHNLMNLYLNR